MILILYKKYNIYLYKKYNKVNFKWKISLLEINKFPRIKLFRWLVMYEMIGILVGLVLINAIVSLLIIDLVYRCYCLIKEENYDLREVFER